MPPDTAPPTTRIDLPVTTTLLSELAGTAGEISYLVSQCRIGQEPVDTHEHFVEMFLEEALSKMPAEKLLRVSLGLEEHAGSVEMDYALLKGEVTVLSEVSANHLAPSDATSRLRDSLERVLPEDDP